VYFFCSLFYAAVGKENKEQILRYQDQPIERIIYVMAGQYEESMEGNSAHYSKT
jgi:hypothetical protein